MSLMSASITVNKKLDYRSNTTRRSILMENFLKTNSVHMVNISGMWNVIVVPDCDSDDQVL